MRHANLARLIQCGLVIELLLHLLSPALAQDLSFKKRFEHSWNERGWQVYAHATSKQSDQLVAINRSSLQVEVLDPKKGETLLQDRLNTRVRGPQLLETLSTQSDEFLVAFAGSDRVVELHSINSNLSFEARVEGAPRSLALVELRPGQIYLVVATDKHVFVYHRGANELSLLQKMTSANPILQMQALRTARGELMLETYDSAGKIHVLEMDIDNKVLVERLSLVRKGVKISGLVNPSGDFILAQSDAYGARLYVDSQSKESARIPLSAGLGDSGWLKGAGNRQWFAAVQRDDDATVLAVYDAYSPSVPIRLGAGDAQSLTEIGVLGLKGKTYYRYVKDHKYLYLQNAHEVAAIPAREGERILGVQVLRGSETGAKLLAVTLESAKGTRLQTVDVN